MKNAYVIMLCTLHRVYGISGCALNSTPGQIELTALKALSCCVTNS